MTLPELLAAYPAAGTFYTAFVRFLFPILAGAILYRAVRSLLRLPHTPETWGQLSLPGGGSVPLTHWEKCCYCGACARACPMGSIDRETMEAVGLCVKCQACVRKCTRRAKFFEDADFLSHVAMLEQNYTRRAENTVLL